MGGTNSQARHQSAGKYQTAYHGISPPDLGHLAFVHDRVFLNSRSVYPFARPLVLNLGTGLFLWQHFRKGNHYTTQAYR
jgi:hypothetical protein